MNNLLTFLSLLFLAGTGSNFWQLAEAQIANESLISIKAIEAEKMLQENKAVLLIGSQHRLHFV